MGDYVNSKTKYHPVISKGINWNSSLLNVKKISSNSTFVFENRIYSTHTNFLAMKTTTQTSKFTSINNQPNPTPASSETKKHFSGFSSVTFGLGKQVKIVSLLLIALFQMSTKGWGQTTVTYDQRIAHYNAGTVFTAGTAGFFNQGTYQVGMYANGGATKQVVAWRTLKTTGDNTGTNRSLRVGDEFRISVSANTVVGEMGFALLASPSSRSSWNDRLNNAAVSVRLSNYGNWYATYSDGTTANAATSTGSNNIGGTTSYKNFVFTCLLTAPNRMNITITDGTTTSNLYDVLLNNSNAITEYSIFLSDDWNGAAHKDIYWNTNSSASSDYVKNTLTMPIGSSNGSFSISGILPDGNAANSTSTASVNALTKSGTGTLTLSGANSYTGATSIAGGTLTLSGSGTVGTGSDVTISSGATLNLNGVNTTVGSISETGSGNGGVVTLGAGTLTINGANKGTKYQNSISGTGGLTMSGSGTTELVLYGTSTTYSGTTTVTGGKLSTSASLSSTAYTVSGGTFQLNAANVIPNAATLTLSGGTFSTGSSTGNSETLGTLTVSTNNSTINLGTGSHTLTFAASNGVSWTAGKFLLITGWAGSYNSTTGTAGKLYIGSSTSGLTAIQLGQIFFWNGTNYYSATQLSDGEVVPTSSITYFSKSGQTAPTTTTNWTVNPDGTGSSPADFTNAAHTFLVQNGHTYTMTANWTVAGTVNVAGTLYVSNSTTARTLQTGNLISSGTIYIDGSSATSSTASSTLTVTGDFTQTAGTIDFNAAAAQSPNTTSTLNIGGNFSQSSGATMTELGGNIGLIIFTKASGTQTYSQAGTFSNTLRISKNAAGTLSLSSDVTWPNQVTISSGTIDFGSTARTMTLVGGSLGTSAINFSGSTVNMSGGNAAHKIIYTGASSTITFPSTWTHGTGDTFEFNQTGTVSIDQNVTFQNLTVTANGAGTILRVGNTSAASYTATVSGNLTVGASTLLTISAASGGTHNLDVTGNVTLAGSITLTGSGATGNLNLYGNISGAGTIGDNATGTVKFLKSSGTQTVSLSATQGTSIAYQVGNGSTTNIVQLSANLDISTSSAFSVENGATFDLQNFILSGGTSTTTFNAKTGSTIITQNVSGLSTTSSTGAVQVGSTKTYATGANYTFNGSLAQVTGNGITGANNLTINNSAGVSLSGAVSVSGTLTFTSGLLTTTSSNLLTITNTSTSAISGAGTGKYVSGPLRWNLSNSNGTYVFAVGKGGNYYPFTLATTAASSPVITVESFNADAGGSLAANISAASTTEYWSATLNSGTFTGNLSLTRPSAITTFDVIAQSSTLTGTYSSIGGTLSSPSVNSSNATSSLGFFKFATSASCADPSTQASGISFTSVGATGMTVNWSGSGNGDGVIVVMKAGSAPTDPSDNTSYTANAAFGSGSNINTDGSYVVYIGSASSVAVTGLTASTNYFVEVFSKNCSGASIKINTTSPANSSNYSLATELAAHPASFTSSATVGGQIDLSYSAANTISNASGYIILQKSGASAPSSTPSDATAYSIGGTIGDGTVADIITDLTQTSSAITGLAGSTQYSYSIIPFSYDGSNSSTYNYYTAATIRTTTATTTAAVTRYAVASGNWNSTSTWSSTSGGAPGSSVPTGSDVVYIQGGWTVTVTSSTSCGTINFDDAGTLSVSSGQTLSGGAINVVQGNKTVSGTISGAGTLTCTTVNIGTGAPSLTASRTTTLTSTISTLTASGATTLTSRTFSSNPNNPTFNLQSGTFSTTGITTVIPSAGGTATLSLASGAQTGTLRLTGTTPFTIDVDGTSSITLNGSGATVEYAASGDQTARNTSYTNLTLSGSGNKTLAAFSISGTLSVQGSAVGITTAPTFGASSTLEYKNVGTRTTNAIEWPSSSGPSNLIIDNSGSTVTMVSSANRTLSGNLTLTAGTLADNGNTLTLQGNIAGTATHSGAGSITMTGASKTISGATLGNLTLNNASGFSLSGSPTINGALTFTAGKLSIGSNTLNLAGTVASMTSTNSITGSTGSSISITGTGTLGTLLFDQTTAGTTNALSALTINRSSTGIVNLGSALNLAGNLTVTNGSLRSSGANTLTMAGTTQTITISNSTGGAITGTDVGSGNDLTLTIANGSTTTFTGDATSSGDEDKKLFNVTVNAGGTLALSRGILCKYGTFTVNGTLQVNANGYVQSTNGAAPTYGASSNLIYNSGSSYGISNEWTGNNSTAGLGVPNNVTIQNSTTLTFPTTNRGCAGNFNISSGGATLNATSGDLYVAGNFTNGGTFTHNNRALFLNGSVAQTLNGTLNGTSTTNCFPFLLINNGGGVTLNTPVNVTNTLTLTTGVVTTTSTNLLHITNTSAGAISGGSSASYISGPLRWSVSNGSGGDYKFHVGKSSTYLPLNVNNPTGTSPVITAEAFAANAGGTGGSGLSSLSTSEYWSVVNTGTLSAATISLAKANIGSNDGIGYSTTLAGTYTNLGGSVTNTLISGNTVTAGTTVGSLATTTYFVLGVKVPAPTITSFTPSSGYVGTAIAITGTNFTNASAVTIGGVAAASYTVNNATSISAVVAAGGATGTISVTTPGGTATSSSSFTFNGYISTQAGDWNSTSTWLGGAVPAASSTVTIDHAVTVNASVTNAVSSVTINASDAITFGASGALTATTVTNNGSIVMTSGGTLTIASSGTLANGTSTFTRGSGTVAFPGTGTVTGTIGFNNVTLAGGVDFGASSTINGTLTINAGGFVNTNAPTYASGSTLRYNTGGPYGRGTEWSATSGVGYPHHVQISTSGTILSLGANVGTATARQLAGDLTVDVGTTLTLNATGEVMTQGLTVKGNYINNGTTTLSGSSGGDLVLEGNLTDNNIFTANGRAIFFRGGNTQTITSNTNPLDIDVMRVEKSGGEIQLLQNLLVDETADPIQFSGTSSILNLNGYTATFGKALTASAISMNATSSIKGSSTSSLTILGAGAFGTVRFDQTTPGTTNVLQNLTINRTSTGSVTLGSNLTVGGTLTLTDGSLIVGANTLTINGDLNRTSGSIDGSNNSANVVFAGSGTTEVPVSALGSNLTNLTVNKSGIVELGGDVTVNGVLTLTLGDLDLGTGNLTLGSSASVSNAGASSHILATSTGELRKIYSGSGSFVFPVGDGTNYTPATVNFTSAGSFNGETNDYLGVRLKTSKVTGMNSNNTNYINRSWFIEPHNSASGYTYTVDLSYDQGDVIGTELEIRPVKLSSGVWQYPGNVSFADGTQLSGTIGSIDTTTNVLTWSGLTTFSEFGGGGQGGPLPVELTSFNASCEDEDVVLNWSTASENNSSHFDVEKSENGTDWRVIGTVLAAGNSTQEINYSFVDAEKTNSHTYYRLNQIDLDGINKYYGPIHVNCINQDYFITYPNPSKNDFNLVLNSELKENAILKITDINGKIYSTKKIELNNGINLYLINEHLTFGLYSIQIITDSGKSYILKHQVQ